MPTTTLARPMRSRCPLLVLAGLGLALLQACGGAGEDPYTFTNEQFSLHAGTDAGPGALVVTLTPVAPWKLNLDYPYASEAGPPGDASEAEVREVRADRFVFDHSLPTPAGTPIPLRTRFAVCIDELCTPIEHRYSVTPAAMPAGSDD